MPKLNRTAKHPKHRFRLEFEDDSQISEALPAVQQGDDPHEGSDVDHVEDTGNDMLPASNIAQVPDKYFMDDDAVIEASGMVDPAALLKYMRIATFTRMVKTGSKSFWRILFAAYERPGSWLKAVHDDLR